MNRRQFFSSSFRAAAAVGLAPQASPAANERIERARHSLRSGQRGRPESLAGDGQAS